MRRHLSHAHLESLPIEECRLTYVMLTIVYALEKFRSYLGASRVIIFINHVAIKYHFTKVDSKPRVIRWVLLIQEFDVVIKYKEGSENVMAGQLSKLVNEEVT